jgi:uncharacterized protein YecE (DUF72 family)
MREPEAPPKAPVVRVGCSGWNYRHWRGLFYPEKLAVKRWFAHYADSFDTVEINNTFYRLPPPSTFEAWRNQAPPGFLYAVKANRFLTQAKKLADCEEPIARMFAAVAHLGGATGPILYQLPPRFRIHVNRLAEFLSLLPGGRDHVFEFRDASWYTDETYALLEAHGASLCVHDMPGLASPRVAVGPLAYVRFHGGQGKYWGRYAEGALERWSDWLAEQSGQGRAVWAYFNNDWEGAAISDALTLRAMLRQAVGRPLPSRRPAFA